MVFEKIKDIINKDNPQDMFKYYIMSVADIVNQNDEQYWAKFKFSKVQINEMLKKCKNVASCRIVSGSRAIMVFLKTIELIKMRFQLYFELTNYTLIPPELSQDQLPLSFKYYDPVITML